MAKEKEKEKLNLTLDKVMKKKAYELKKETGFSISTIFELLLNKASKEELRKEYDKSNKN